MKVSLERISKSYGNQSIIRDITLSIRSGEMFFLLGPSGCGKSTILRLLAGFIQPDQGSIHFDDRLVNALPPQERNTALVFQNYSVWPHLTVFENVAYGLQVRHIPPQDLKKRVEEALRLTRLEELAARKPSQLSGGQQQRVALARALVIRPDLLLLDEPLSNLDAKLRLEMRDEIKRLHGELPTTSLYVTHDQEEALSLADRIAVMHQGNIEQIGTPQEIYESPQTPFVASFVGEMNLFPAGSPIASLLSIPADRSFGFRPEHVIVNASGHPAHVISSQYLGNKSVLHLKMASGEMIKAWHSEPLSAGQSVNWTVAPEKICRFSP